MTNEEAIVAIDSAKAEVGWAYPMEYAVAFDMAIEALEKQIPKKPKDVYACGYIDGTEEKVYICECGHKIYDNIKFCSCCGQAIDWSEEDDE